MRDSFVRFSAYIRRKKMYLMLTASTIIVVSIVIAGPTTSMLTGSVTQKKNEKTADMSITYSAPTNVLSGESITQEIDVTNAGPDTVRMFTIQQLPDAGLTLLSATTSDRSGRVVCDRKKKTGSLICEVQAPGQGLQATGHMTVTLTFSTHRKKEPIPCGKTMNLYEIRIATNEPKVRDPDASNNVAQDLGVFVDCSDITSEMAVHVVTPSSTVIPNEAFTYLASATNYGPAPASGVKIRHRYSPGMAFVSASIEHCTDDHANHTVTCATGDDENGVLGIMEASQSTQIEMRFMASPELSRCTSVSGVTSVEIPEGARMDPTPENNEATLQSEVECL